MGIYRCRDCEHQELGQRLWAVRSLCISKYPTRYQCTPKYSWKCCSGLLWGKEAALIQECVNWAQPRKSGEIWAWGAQQCSQLQADEIFATSIRERIEIGAVYPQDWFFKITTISHEGWWVSLPRQGWRQWRHKLFLLPKISGEADREMLVYSVVDSFSLLLCWSHALFSIPSATWHTKHISRHWSPDTPCGLQVPFYTAPTSPNNLLPGKGDCCFHHKTEGREKLWAESPRKRDRNSLSLIKCAIQNLVNREMKSSCWEMEREIAFWPWGNLCL